MSGHFRLSQVHVLTSRSWELEAWEFKSWELIAPHAFATAQMESDLSGFS